MSRADQMNMFDLCNQMDLESPICRVCILPENSYIAEINIIVHSKRKLFAGSFTILTLLNIL